MERLSVNDALFNEEANPAIPAIRRFFTWILFNAPDLSFLMGWKRVLSNIVFLIFILYIMFFFGLDYSLLSLLLRMTIVAPVVFVLYSRMIAFSCLQALEYWKNLA